MNRDQIQTETPRRESTWLKELRQLRATSTESEWAAISAILEQAVDANMSLEDLVRLMEEVEHGKHA